MQDESVTSLTEFHDFLRELNSIVNKLRETRVTFSATEAVGIFYELGTTEEIKEKLLIFGQCLVEISKSGTIPDPRSMH